MRRVILLLAERPELYEDAIELALERIHDSWRYTSGRHVAALEELRGTLRVAELPKANVA